MIRVRKHRCSARRRGAVVPAIALHRQEAPKDDTQFDAWTRRGFGAAASGLAGSLLALSALPVAEARKKKKKKKCRKLNDTCNSGKEKCCCGYECQFRGMSAKKSCCRAAGFPANSAQDCCSGLAPQVGECICKTLGQPCAFDENCCSGDCDTGINKCVGPV
jgi:hypothetical protein